jgi:hypothetical protein
MSTVCISKYNYNHSEYLKITTVTVDRVIKTLSFVGINDGVLFHFTVT